MQQQVNKEFLDNAQPKSGDFEIEIWEGDRLVGYSMEHNVIVIVGRAQIAQMLGGTTITNRPLTKIGFGVGTAAATTADTTLTTAFVKNITTGIPGTGVTYPATTSVKFSWSLENAEGNGLAITEFGLLSTDGTLFARKVRTAIAKTSAIRLVGTWTINV